jgi:hypothetical protein
VQIEGTELTEKGQRARSNRLRRLSDVSNRRQADIADADEGKRASAAAVIRVLSPRTADAIQTINRGRGRGDAQLRRGVAEALDMRLRLRRNSRLPIMAIAVSKSGQDVGKPEKSAIGQTRAA